MTSKNTQTLATSATSATPEALSSSTPDPQVKAVKRTPRRSFSVQQKLDLLETYEACATSLARGAFLRREGLYYSRICAWRKQRDNGELTAQSRKKSSKTGAINQQLTRENAQLKKRLAQADAIIELQKKVSELLGTHILSPESNENS